jgi:hypothetical protein
VGAALPSIVRVMADVEDSLVFDVVVEDLHPGRSSVFEDLGGGLFSGLPLICTK